MNIEPMTETICVNSVQSYISICFISHFIHIILICSTSSNNRFNGRIHTEGYLCLDIIVNLVIFDTVNDSISHVHSGSAFHAIQVKYRCWIDGLQITDIPHPIHNVHGIAHHHSRVLVGDVHLG